MTAPGTKFGERERKLLTKLMRSVGSNFEHESTAARAAIDRLLKQFGRGWGDLVELLGGSPHFIHPDLVRELAALGSVDHASARTSINSTLDRHHQSWNGLVDELCSLTPALWVCVSWSGDANPEPAADLLEPVADLLELLVGTLKKFIEVKPAEYVTIALWVLHTHCFR